jgi:hypothetical protein
MSLSDDFSDKNGKRVIRLFEDILATLPAGVADLDARRTRDGSGTIVFLQPKCKRSAVFSIHVDDHLNLIDVSLGDYTTFELSSEADLPNGANFDLLLATAKEMCFAVIAGRCEHRFGLLGIQGTIRVDEQKIYRGTNFFHPRLIPKVVHYAPYYPAISG